MNTLHYVKHPTLQREGLHHKRLAVKNDEGDISAGYMEASLPRQDGRYVLKLVYDPRVPVAPAENLGGLGQTSAERVLLAQGVDSLDQGQVELIRKAEASDAVSGCDFVLDGP
ncbi:MAG: hypothetical protein ABSC03_00410 [Verrucomicrobiota bacterium]|jgi:hypothetical protein